jgi:hypothetical protein
MRWSAVLFTLGTLCAACGGRTDETPGESAGTGGAGAAGSQDASIDSCKGTGGCPGGAGGTGPAGGAAGNGGYGGDIFPPEDRTLPRDIGCFLNCSPPGGQYCGRFYSGCGPFLDCGSLCQTPGFTCGGAGRVYTCGAPPDSGCTPTDCSPGGGRYCGVVGDGCGGNIDCGGCPINETCGGSGVANVCGPSGEGGTSLPPPPVPAPPPPPPPF